MKSIKRQFGPAHVMAALLAITQTMLMFSAGAAAITRGPYLQQGTTNSLVLRWRTDLATASFVQYGVSANNPSALVSDTASVTEHIIAVTNLQPATKYFYQIGTATAWFPADTNNYFVTAPPVGIPKATRIWAIGDAGTANAEQAAVRDAYIGYAGSRPTDLWLMLGDNAYSSGQDTEYQAAVFDVYPSILRNSVLWPTLGNHDAG